MSADVTLHRPRTVLECPRCEGDHLALEYCGCARGRGDVYACQNYDCDFEVTRGGDDAEELLRRLVTDYGDDLRQLCDHPEDCECSAAAVLRYAGEEGE